MNRDFVMSVTCPKNVVILSEDYAKTARPVIGLTDATVRVEGPAFNFATQVTRQLLRGNLFR